MSKNIPHLTWQLLGSVLIVPAVVWSSALIGAYTETINPACVVLDPLGSANSGTLLYELSVSLDGLLHNGSFALAGLLALAAGLLTALSPCVYPLIPITLGIMGARRYESKLHGFTVALAYVSGMIFLYSSLGIVFASLGILAGSVLQNPYVNTAIGIFFIVMALSMLGVFALVLPQKFLQRVIKIGGAGHRGAFLMGLVSGLIAAPCTGPVLAFILTLVAVDGNIATGAYLTLLYATGIGLPFLLLGTFSSMIARLPKGGRLMGTVKYIFALAMLGAAGYYLLLAVPIFQQQVSSPSSWLEIGPHDSPTKLTEALGAAKQNCQPVMIDFHASWCAACQELDRHTLADPRVRALLDKFVVIRIDATTNTPLVEEVQRRYRVVGLPTLLFFQPNGALINEWRVTEFVPPEAFAPLLSRLLK